MIGLAGLAAAVAALALRGVGGWSFVVPVAGGVTALAAVRPAPRVGPAASWLMVTASGSAAFVIVRLLSHAHAPRAGALALAASAGAAVGEELVFRHGLYGVLERWGPAAAAVGSAVLFGLVHAPVYGWRFVPVDAAAGLVLGWQRGATGGWTAPALTHVVANIAGSI